MKALFSIEELDNNFDVEFDAWIDDHFEEYNVIGFKVKPSYMFKQIVPRFYEDQLNIYRAKLNK